MSCENSTGFWIIKKSYKITFGEMDQNLKYVKIVFCFDNGVIAVMQKYGPVLRLSMLYCTDG